MEYFKIEEGVVVNVIAASQEFINTQQGTYVEAQQGYGINDTYDGTSFHKHVLVLTEQQTAFKRATAITWRNRQLASTDPRSVITDDSQHTALMTYRQALRDWPSTSDFPDTRPTL